MNQFHSFLNLLSLAGSWCAGAAASGLCYDVASSKACKYYQMTVFTFVHYAMSSITARREVDHNHCEMILSKVSQIDLSRGAASHALYQKLIASPYLSEMSFYAQLLGLEEAPPESVDAAAPAPPTVGDAKHVASETPSEPVTPASLLGVSLNASAGKSAARELDHLQ